MQKVYKYGNAVVYVEVPENNSELIHKATKNFLRKVLKESIRNGNSDQSRDIRKK